MKAQRMSVESRPAARRILLRGFVLIAVSIVTCRVVTGILTTSTSDPFEDVRIRTLIDHLSEIAAYPSDKVVVVGSSRVMTGFSPALFDAEMTAKGKPLTSFNLGVGRLNPELQLLLVRRLTAAYRRIGAKNRLSLVEFCPHQATIARRVGPVAAKVAEAREALLGDAGSTLAVARAAPGRAFRILLYRYLFDGVSPFVLSNALFDALETEPTWWPAHQDAFDVARLHFRRELDRIYPRGRFAWSMTERGYRSVVTPSTEETYRTVMLPWLTTRENLADDLNANVTCCDILGLDFDDRFVAAFLDVIREIQSISEATYVLLAPNHPDWIRYAPDARARLAQVVRRIETETGVTVVDFSQAPSITASDFQDSVHLNGLSGADKWSRILAAFTAHNL
jgi:hypothetical protein